MKLSQFYPKLCLIPYQGLCKSLVAGVTLFTLAACASGTYPAHAQSQNNVRVIVMGEDEDPNSVERSNNVYDRVMAELKQSMMYKGFQMVDEEMMAADLGWRVYDRRSKEEMIGAAKMANSESRANLYSRVLTLFRIYATKQDLGYATKLQIRIEGELYDLENNSFLGSFELPRMTASGPANCSQICINEKVGDKAREIAAGLGDVLGTKLAFLTPAGGGSGGGSSSGGGSVATSSSGDSRCNSMLTNYTLEFKRFETREISDVMNAITNSSGGLSAADRFPCYQSHDMMSGGNSAIRRYSYGTTANRAKLYDWLNMILMDIGMKPDHDVLILNNGNSIIMERVLQRTNANPVPEGAKFQ